MAPKGPVYRWDELDLEKVTEMIARKAIVGVRETMVQTFLKRGALVPRHVHGTEQFIYVLQGALRARVGDEDAATVREGEVLQVPAGAPHQIEALDDTFVLDIKGTEGPCS
ncbi:MAG TPA: cupin domain-containing protein [Vicinamibacterales bacterium]